LTNAQIGVEAGTKNQNEGSLLNLWPTLMQQKRFVVLGDAGKSAQYLPSLYSTNCHNPQGEVKKGHEDLGDVGDWRRKPYLEKECDNPPYVVWTRTCGW
jgi:hypothetical protein